MKNLKKKRLGYGYCNARGEQCIVVEYKNNKHVVVRNVTRGTTHKCRWLDLRNPKCVTVYDATASRKRFESEIDEAVVNEGLSKETIEAVKKSDEYDFKKALPDVGKNDGLAASVLVISIEIAGVALLWWLACCCGG